MSQNHAYCYRAMPVGTLPHLVSMCGGQVLMRAAEVRDLKVVGKKIPKSKLGERKKRSHCLVFNPRSVYMMRL